MKIPLFDIDWTLVDGANKYHREAFKYAFSSIYGLKSASLEDLNPQGMIDSQILIETVALYGIGNEQAKIKVNEAMQTMVDYYMKNVGDYKCSILPGVKELLSILKLKDIPCGLLTGNIETIGREKMTKANLNQHFPFGGFGNEALKRVDLINIAKIKAETVLNRAININELVIVGDTPLDVACAKEGGIESIAVATGKYSKEDLQASGADIVLTNLEERAAFLAFITS